VERVIALAGADDTENMLPLETQRARIEARAIGRDERSRSATPSGLRRFFEVMLRPAVATPLAVAVLAVFTLVPFTYHQTVGYDVTLAGVSRDMAVDDEIVCDLLHTLGLTEAAVDVHGCDTTCSLSILDLKTRGEAQLVVGAIARLSESAVTTDIVPIRARTSGSLLEKAIGRGES
jgi:hypothetical protein